ncbi:MAG: hypothetical protein KGJ89_05395 [Patescibacteria group bacterium]|nr:hypothetical protein [Patescibacteria group bacterium]MDE2015867.1 hypothetical protein [Patescibacteria group bacterium]MDE2227356.1 hypothetical protein [Patescibacteria group bacterium]
MDPEAQQRALVANQLRQRELARKSQDIIRIYNPLYQDFRFLYDGYPNTVKARETKDVERYKAELYFKKISQYIIGLSQIEKGEALLKKRRDRGLDEILDKYQESKQIWDNTPKMNDPQLLEQIAKVVIIGLVEEYGKEEPLPGQREEPKPEMTNVDEIIFRKIADRKIEAAPEPVAKPVTKTLDEMKKDEDGAPPVKKLEKAK